MDEQTRSAAIAEIARQWDREDSDGLEEMPEERVREIAADIVGILRRNAIDPRSHVPCLTAIVDGYWACPDSCRCQDCQDGTSEIDFGDELPF